MDQSPILTGGPVSGSSSAKKRLIVAVALLMILLIAGGVALAVFSRNKDDSAAQSQTTKAERFKGTHTTLKASIMTDYGYTVTVNDLVADYQPKSSVKGFYPVLIKVTIAQSGALKFGGVAPLKANFVLNLNGKEIAQGRYPSGATEADLYTDGYENLIDTKPTASRPSSGYILFGVPKGDKPTLLRLKQKQAKTLSPESTLAAKDFDLSLINK